MLHITPAQRYAKAAAQAERDRKRVQHDTPVFSLGDVTLGELRGLMGLSLQGLSDALDGRWSKQQLSRAETGARATTKELYAAVRDLYEKRKKNSSCPNRSKTTEP